MNENKPIKATPAECAFCGKDSNYLIPISRDGVQRVHPHCLNAYNKNNK